MNATRVADLLRALAPADALEAEHVRAMFALLEAGGDPFARDHFVPGHFTASAFVTSPDGGSLLLVHHAKLHRWLQPGGHIEPTDADVFAAARREVAEEAGLTSVDGEARLLDVDVHEIPPLKGDPPHRHYDLRVHLRAATWEIRAGSDAKAARWTPLAEVNASDSDESVLRAVRKLAR